MLQNVALYIVKDSVYSNNFLINMVTNFVTSFYRSRENSTQAN